MDLSSLKPAEGSVKSGKRIGRGQGSGRGGTSTKGHKGQKARSGYSKKIGFEGGQMPIQRRTPKFGFKNFNRVEYSVVNLSDLQKLAETKNITEFDIATFIENGFVAKTDKIKILGSGELTMKVQVKAHAFSKRASEIIVAQGGTAEKL
jgi:large subunit ribosomal protein L15